MPPEKLLFTSQAAMCVSRPFFNFLISSLDSADHFLREHFCFEITAKRERKNKLLDLINYQDIDGEKWSFSCCESAVLAELRPTSMFTNLLVCFLCIFFYFRFANWLQIEFVFIEYNSLLWVTGFMYISFILFNWQFKLWVLYACVVKVEI